MDSSGSDTVVYVVVVALVLLLLIVLAQGLRIVQQYQRGLVLRLGKVSGPPRGPGLRLIVPVIDKMTKVDMRIVTLPVEPQQIITRDNVSIEVAAVAYYQVVDATKAVVEIDNVIRATYQIAATTVRNVVGQAMLDHVLSDTATINVRIKEILDTATVAWGVYVSTVELKDIKLPPSMQRAMAKEAEAEREKRAKIIAAEGEALSVAKLAEAADVIAAHPIALQLRNLQVLAEIATEKNSTIVFPQQFLTTIADVERFVGGEHAAAPRLAGQ